MTNLIATPTWSDEQALRFSAACLELGDERNPGMRQLASAVIRLHARVESMRLLEHDRMILKTLAWDREANRIWPETCRVIQEWIDKTEAK